ncbi:ammonium transporter 2 [Quercus suber]|uniref:Ammonium transporter 2 n=1 Tax=Quercus suber TaxID=58331 RepID=A0AAW0KHL5_QUESU
MGTPPIPIAYQSGTSLAVPDWLNKGDNAWQMISATLVGLQSVPGLVILYGSIVKKKWAVNSAFMALYAFAAVVICWVTWAYKMSFGDKLLPFWGKAGPALGQNLWGGGFLFHWGVMDYSGGYVIHLSSGIGGFTAAYWRFPPNNVLLTLAGAGLLWMGWAGFNGGDPYAANIDSSMAVLNTNICAATSLLMWTSLDVIFFNKPSVIGAVQGMITGLSKLLQKVDDTLGVFHTHAVAGLLGGILTGLFAEPELCNLFLPVTNSRGGVYGGNGGIQVGKQIVGGLFIIGWNLVVTTIICLVIKLVIPLRMPDDLLLIGDDAVHGEEAYALWGDGEKDCDWTNSVVVL